MDQRALTVSDLGESALLSRLLPRLPVGSDVIAGPGDDCAIIGRPRARLWRLLKTDCVIENVHFLPETDPRRVGWKALCRAISDIAAMGGIPEHAMVTIAVPRTQRVTWVEALYKGFRKAAQRFGVGIVGGETARSPGAVMINVALTGIVPRRQCVRRDGGRPGDRLYVTGRLGGSIHGKHLDFTPRLAEARWLAEHFRPNAMMDLSDGLGADLPRLAEASGCGFLLNEGSVPRTINCSTFQAINDGEDYELLIAMNERRAVRLEADWKKAFPRLQLNCIGALITPSRTRKPLHALGFDHFRKAV